MKPTDRMLEKAGLAGTSSHLILYDGLCGLCSRLNRFVLARDSAGAFCFASLQSTYGRSLLVTFGRDPDVLETFYVVANCWTESPTLLTKSRAALFVANVLGRPWRWAGLFGVLPTPLLDWLYDRVARNRYRLFGRHDICPLPSPGHAGRFIEI